jgi:hypothetical protein
LSGPLKKAAAGAEGFEGVFEKKHPKAAESRARTLNSFRFHNATVR